MFMVLAATLSVGVFLTVIGLGLAANDWAARRSRMRRRLRTYVDPVDMAIIGMPTTVEYSTQPELRALRPAGQSR